MWFNAYAFNRMGERVIIDMGLPYGEAIRRCEYEAAFIESMGDQLTRFADAWYEPGMVVRVAMCYVHHDPFSNLFDKAIWLPDSSEL